MPRPRMTDAERLRSAEDTETNAFRALIAVTEEGHDPFSDTRLHDAALRYVNAYHAASRARKKVGA